MSEWSVRSPKVQAGDTNFIHHRRRRCLPAAFNPDADVDRSAEIGEAQFRRFLAAQKQIRARMEERFGELQDRELQCELDDRLAEPGLAELVGAYRDLGGLLLEAKCA